MADEVPVSDVLCEAMEYLTKLGSNLRARSESLKEKRIRKDKLKNSHAIRKAADKVLLICELSKKSLENVENGVKKVLSLVHDGQKPSVVAGKSSSFKKPEEKEDYQYFKYRSYKLRISKKVPIKHYMSAKVLARRMPLPMHDKYPVFYNCKLYRKRKRGEETLEKVEKTKEKKSVDNVSNLNDKIDSSSSEKNKNKHTFESSSGVKSSENVMEVDEECKVQECSEKRKISVDSSKSKTDLALKNDKKSKCTERDNSHAVEKLKKDDKSKHKDDDRILESNKKDKKDNDENIVNNKKSKSFKHIRVIDDSSENSNEVPVSTVDDTKTMAENPNPEAVGDDTPQSHKSKKIKLSSPEDDIEIHVEKDKSLDSRKDEGVKESEISEEKETIDLREDNKEKSSKDDSESENIGLHKEQSNSAEVIKPLIKCVSISKLLKPDVLRKCSENLSRTKPKEKKTSNLKRHTTKYDDGEYWIEKRKEVSAFKPKTFVININRLPKLSVTFLHTHNLKRITQNEKVVCELVNNKCNEVVDSSSIVKNVGDSEDSVKKNQSDKIKKVKSALLNDSDSEKSGFSKENSPIEMSEISETVRNVILNYSDNETKENEQQNIHKLKNDLLLDSDSDKNTNSNDCASKKNCDNEDRSDIQRTEQVKNALLCESDSDKEDSNFRLSTKNFDGDPEKDQNSRLNEEKENKQQDIHKLKNDLLVDSDSDKNTNSNESASKKNCDNEDRSDIQRTEQVKNALLYESDSDKEDSNFRLSTKNFDGDPEKDQNSRLNEEKENKQQDRHKLKNDFVDSDSDKNTNSNESASKKNCDNETRSDIQRTEQVKNALLCESDSDKEDSNFRLPTKNFDGDPEKDQNSRLNEDKKDTNPELESQKEKQSGMDLNEGEAHKSSENGQKTPPPKKKRHKSKTPKSKRKNIMESMHAKRMLLTYSSSSDTEDEQLRNALKEIKDSLLKGASSDDEKQIKPQSEKSGSSSNSEIDSIIKVKKKKQKSQHNQSSTDKSENSDSKKSDQSIVDKSSHRTNKKMGRSRAETGGSSQNSDSQDINDKDIDGLTNLNNLTKNRRRRDSASTDQTDTNSIRKDKMPKQPLISEEIMLKADSSSEGGSASGAESDVGEAEDLPPISISGLNGSSVDHLAKDDLLDESDTSSEHNEESKNESGDSNPKSKRRKANAISSDSEAGSSRKKAAEVKVSDFEDSEDESSEPVKRSKRKKESDSDASMGSSSNDGKKKRRRIKQLDSDVSGSDTENEGRNKHGRKNIRKVMGKNQLEEATKKAAREEKERMARIIERQKLYNNLEFDESGKPDEVVLEKVVLDFDPETKEPLIQVDRGLVKKLKPHQANGIKFMWDACFESVKRIKKDRGSGCILAHCMGLGKTLQVVSLTHTLLTHSDLTNVNRVLVVCPLSTVLNWVNEFTIWLKHAETEYDVDVYELSRHKQNSERAFQLQQWVAHGGVCVLGYEMFRNLSADNPKKFKKKMLKNFQEALVDPGPDLVVCDEGHLLKNEKTSLSQSMNRVKTRRRIVLTGTPLQNNLKEYYCMVQFVKPNLLGKYNEYLNRFVNPITNGQYTDSTEHDIRIMKRRSHVLHKMLDGAVQRRDYGVLAPFLPPKHEYVLFITLTEVQIKLYQHYLDNYSRRPLPGKSSGFLFPDFQSLQRIWTHPLVLKYNSERYEIMQQKKREREEEDSEGSLVDFIDDESTPDESTTDESSDDLSDMSDDSRKKSKKKKSPKKSKGKDSKISTRRGTRANPVELDEDEANNDVIELKAENPTEWWIPLVTDDEIEDLRNSHKLILLFDILRQCEAIGDKLLVFSQSLYSLDLIEHFLGKVDEATQEGRIDEKLGGHVGSWSPGVDYFRLDGSTSCENRSIWCKNFNREDNPRARLFLISTRAGGLGINLVAANRVVIFDVSWNPSHDVQSIFRVYRFGQKKPCYIYRFLAMGTMEEKIYERQVTKQAISKRVIDEQQIDRHYAENDLAELYKFEPRPPSPRPLPPLPKDRLFAEMLREHDKQIYKYHEHDSLLENKEEETLSEEERKAAWEDFENEKNRPPPAPFPSAWPMHNGMVPGLLAQQQQQLAYAALAAMLRKDMPNINDNQIRDMLPLIYNANPAMFGGYDFGLMQKMTEIYKYASPGGMMNPAMMNPVMNAAGGGGGAGAGGMGGTSGLQYEPPWQRQHQQQQQMRLQQLMQHQNPMGAKYYAGGLGSRDPVAMALQQQRAREIMAGESRGRPRGRPPLQPRAPPAHAAGPAPAAPAAPPGDVVNLDSD